MKSANFGRKTYCFRQQILWFPSPNIYENARFSQWTLSSDLLKQIEFTLNIQKKLLNVEKK